MTYGLKVSRQGIDAETTDNKSLALNSERIQLQIDNIETSNIVCSGGVGGTKMINHGLSFIPVVLAFININGSNYAFPFSSSDGSSFGNIAINSSQIVFDVLADDGTYPIYYFISKSERL